ncbi:MAG TPA: ribosome biogenesis GTPase Der [Terriglobia bacterium]|nr:ribosome biogenesis GTPase Der [Terriglobia bacterium]
MQKESEYLMPSSLPLIAIVGRPNVGKSTLFNRLIGQRRSIVTDEPGITRDRIYGTVSWHGRSYEIVDTGGIVPGEETEIPVRIFEQAQIAIESASLIFLVVDGRTSITAPDQELTRLLRRTSKPLFLVVNKIDSAKQAAEVSEFYRLGIDHVFPVSSEHGRGITELLDEVAISMPAPKEEDEDASGEIRVAIIGRPNVGKSTLLNKLVGQERAMVSPIAGTTRDAVDSVVHHEDLTIRFVDTAGIRRKGKTELKAEKLSVVMARRHLERSDVAILVIDGVEGVTALDAHIGGYAHEAGRSVIIAVNKWDAVQKTHRVTADYETEIREKLKFLSFAPIVFISAKTGQRVQKLYGTINEVHKARFVRVPTRELNEFLRQETLSRGGLPSDVKIRYIAQVKTNPPTFVMFSNKLKKLHFSFERFIENRIRERFPFPGTPIIIKQRLKNADARNPR